MKHVLVYGMTSNPGGIETYLLNFYRRVQGKTVLLDFVSDFTTVSGSGLLEAHGSRIHYIPAKSRDLKGHLAEMWRILRQHGEYECVYYNILDAGAVVTMLPAFLLGRRIVVHSHNNATDKTRLHRICKPFLNLLADGRVTCSHEAAVHMFGSKQKDYLFVPNLIDAAAYRFDPDVRQKKRRELGLGAYPVICHVGRLSRQKNPIGLLDIFSQVRQRCSDAVLLSIGTGEMEEEFRKAIKTRGLEDSVLCLGVRNDVAEILQAADIFLLPSLYEGLPFSLLEAQAAGLPCVASDVISKEAAVTETVHFMSLEAGAEAWAAVILECMKKPHQDACARIAVAGFDVSNCEEYDKQLIAMF